MEGAIIFGFSSCRKWEKCGNSVTRDLVDPKYTAEAKTLALLIFVFVHIKMIWAHEST